MVGPTMNLISGTYHSCKKEVRIYGTPGVHNNFPFLFFYFFISTFLLVQSLLLVLGFFFFGLQTPSKLYEFIYKLMGKTMFFKFMNM